MSKTVSPSANTALATIELVLDNLGPAFCAYLVLPNAVLTLANARGFSDGVFYNTDKQILKQWQSEMRQLFTFLKKHRDFIYVTEIIPNPGGDWYVGYDFMSPDGLLATLPNYSFLNRTIVEKLVKHDNLVTLAESLMDELRRSPGLQDYLRHIDDITSGVILGYPEKAILGSVIRFDQPTNQFPEQLVQADIRGADYYQCPQPIYDYPRKLVNDPDIKKHEHLWTSILQTYYTSPLHKKLVKDKAFADKIKILTQF